MKLNLGCGRNKLPGFVNVDLAVNDPDVVLDLTAPNMWQWATALRPDLAGCSVGKLDDMEAAGELNMVDYAQLIHVLEHIPNYLQMMENLWRVMNPGGYVYIRCPHGASDDAFEDPTHVNYFFPGSFLYFGQPFYWRADYGYRGDFHVERCELIVDPKFRGRPLEAVDHMRNVVQEMIVTLQAIKPARPPDAELRQVLHPIVTLGA